MANEKLADELTRPLIGIENRTPKEVFDIMCDRIRYTLRRERGEGVECLTREQTIEAVQSLLERGRATLDSDGYLTLTEPAHEKTMQALTDQAQELGMGYETAGVVELLREARELIEADRLIEAGKAHRGEIFRCPVRQLCRGIDAALSRLDKGSE